MVPGTDLLALTAELVDIASVSHHETALVDHLQARLQGRGLEVVRIGDELVARTLLGRPSRVVLAGHTDTVPAQGNAGARVEGDVCWGVGAADMKAGLAVMVALAEGLSEAPSEPAHDVTYVFYSGEEVAAEHNGLARLLRERPDLVQGDVAVLGEPTGGAIEAGCQGTLRMEITLRGSAAHTARPWVGRNAVHRLGPVLGAVAGFEERRPVLDGYEFREALQAVSVSGGVAGNVVPDRATLTVNHRFAPDRSPEQAEAAVRALLSPVLEPGDEVVLVDVAAGAPPALDHPLLRGLARRRGLERRAKLGWTDVARFAAVGIPALNLGPGDPLLAHTAAERVDRAALEATFAVLAGLLHGS